VDNFGEFADTTVRNAVETLDVSRFSVTIEVDPVTMRFTCRNRHNDAGWSSLVAREAHNLEVAGSNPVPAIFSKYRRNKHLCYLPAVGSAA
jgi:hypothetical protein